MPASTTSLIFPKNLKSSPEAIRQFWQMKKEAWQVHKSPPKLSGSEWAEEYRILAPETSPEPGRWRNNRAEYLRGIIDEFTNSTSEIVDVIKNSRSGVTEASNNAIGYWSMMDPGPIAIFQPNDRLAEKYSRDHLDLMVRDMEVLKNVVSPERSRNRDNTLQFKRIIGGSWYVIGANTPASFRQINARYIIKDDLDAWPMSAGREGDPGKLADKRAQNYANRKILNISKPTVKGLSRIEASFLNSSQKHFYVPCPHCKHFQILIFGPRSQYAEMSHGFLKYDQYNLNWVFYECENCRKPIEEKYKSEMVQAGKWVAKYPERVLHAGFHISQLYSSWSSWKEIVAEFLEAKGSREAIRAFVNDTLGESFAENEEIEFSGEMLMDRREDYQDIPERVIFLTAGVDTQDDRFEVVVRGWGLRDENWFIDRYIVHGSPADPETRKKLDEYLFGNRWKHSGGFIAGYGELGGLIGVGIDTQGHFAEQMYRYVKERQGKRIFALKGIGGFGKKIIHRDSRDKKIKARLIIVGVDTAKQLIYDWLRSVPKPDPIDSSKRTLPAGFMHFSMRCNAEYFDQLTSEKTIIKKKYGQPTRIWQLKEGKRNEVLDCEVNALTARILLNPDMDALMKSLQEKITNAKAQPAQSIEEKEREQEAKPKARQIVRKISRNKLSVW